MARIRTIKPELWDSQKLGQLSVLARLTFVGLISMADDEGRGRGTATYLGARLHPYAKDVTPQAMDLAMGELAKAGLVTCYSVDGCGYYALPNWREHQRIEASRPSSIPAPAPSDPTLFDEPSAKPRRILGPGMEGKGREEETDSSPAAPPAAVAAAPRARTAGDHLTILAIWNSAADPVFPRATATDRRTKALKARWSDKPDAHYWMQVVQRINASPFCRGAGGRDWVANFDFLLRPETHVKVMEGAYDDARARVAKTRKETVPTCTSCGVKPRAAGARCCTDCAWCVLCDRDGRPSKLDPKAAQVRPDGGMGMVCATCAKGIKK